MNTKYTAKYMIVTMLSMAAILLPLTASAQDKPKIKSIDLVIPVPKPGTDLWDAREVQATSATTEYGDLVPTGDVQIMEADYIGDFVEKDSGEMLFKSGFDYKAVFKVMVNPSGKYQTDYYFKNNDYGIDGSRIKITVNGKEAKVKPSTPYFISIETMVSVGKGGAGSEREAALNMKSDYELNKDSYRRSRKAYSIERGFVNIMEVGEEYLVFIENQVDGLGEKIPVYQVYVENAFTPIFSYQEHENNICETGGESTYVKYNQVCENEFFATTQKGMDALVGLKKEMIEKYNEK